MTLPAHERRRAGDDVQAVQTVRPARRLALMLLACVVAMAALMVADGLPLDCPPCPVPSIPVTSRMLDQEQDFRGIAVDRGVLYGVTADHGIWSIEFAGSDSARVRFEVSLAGSQGGARGLAVDPLGRWAVADSIRQSVGFYGPDGSLVGSVDLPSRPSPVRPTGVAIDGDNTVYVVDARGDSVLVLPGGMGAWSSFPIPEGSEHTGLAFIRDTGLLGTIDRPTRELIIFDRTGICVTSCPLGLGEGNGGVVGFGAGSTGQGAPEEEGHTGQNPLENPPTTEIGSFPVGEPTTPLERSTWGRLKGLYR